MEDKNFVSNLLRKLSTRLHGATINKAIASLLIASSLTLSLASCQINVQPNGDGSINVDVEKDPVNNNEDDKEINNSDENENENENNFDASVYSELLQNVLNNEQYDALIAQAKNTDPAKQPSINAFQPHPYAFLQSEGFNVESIKSGNTKAYTMSYILDEEPNNVYMHTRVESGSNYVHYLLKYELTDEEMEDYLLVHRPNGDMHYFIQSCFMNNEISKSRRPEIIEKSKISKLSHDSLTESLDSLQLDFGDYYEFILTDLDKSAGTFNITMIPKNYVKNMASSNEIMTIACKSRFPLSTEDDILKEVSTLDHVRFLSSEKEDATFLFPQDVKILYGLCGDLETNYKK